VLLNHPLRLFKNENEAIEVNLFENADPVLRGKRYEWIALWAGIEHCFKYDRRTPGFRECHLDIRAGAID